MYIVLAVSTKKTYITARKGTGKRSVNLTIYGLSPHEVIKRIVDQLRSENDPNVFVRPRRKRQADAA